MKKFLGGSGKKVGKRREIRGKNTVTEDNN